MVLRRQDSGSDGKWRAKQETWKGYLLSTMVLSQKRFVCQLVNKQVLASNSIKCYPKCKKQRGSTCSGRLTVSPHLTPVCFLPFSELLSDPPSSVHLQRDHSSQVYHFPLGTDQVSSPRVSEPCGSVGNIVQTGQVVISVILLHLQLCGSSSGRTYPVARHAHQQRRDQRGAPHQSQRDQETEGEEQGA